VNPSSTETTRKIPRLGAIAASPAAAAVTTRTREASVQLSITSPSGISTMMPAAYPSWVTVTTMAAELSVTPNVFAIRASTRE
jgi:hypothetical protein